MIWTSEILFREVLYMEEFRHEHREKNAIALIVVLFVLLIVVGASFMSGMGGY
jgi:uncharacterized protein (TIGR01732 family)